MADVYLALQSQPAFSFSKKVALKLIRLTSVELFDREARVVGALGGSRNVVQCFDVGVWDDGRPYIAMEFVDGPSLRRVIDCYHDHELSMPEDIVLEIAIQLCSGLEQIHQTTDAADQPLEVVHRDLKPANLMISRAGDVKICDFGVAKARVEDATLPGDLRIRGTPRYMSPEQARGEPVDHRSDIFAAGLILFEMLTLTPFYAGTAPLLLASKARTKARLASLTRSPLREGLLQVMTTSLARDPSRRYRTAGDMAAALKQIRDELKNYRDNLRAWLLELRPYLASFPALKASEPPPAPGAASSAPTVLELSAMDLEPDSAAACDWYPLNTVEVGRRLWEEEGVFADSTAGEEGEARQSHEHHATVEDSRSSGNGADRVGTAATPPQPAEGLLSEGDASISEGQGDAADTGQSSRGSERVTLPKPLPQPRHTALEKGASRIGPASYHLGFMAITAMGVLLLIRSDVSGVGPAGSIPDVVERPAFVVKSPPLPDPGEKAEVPPRPPGDLPDATGSDGSTSTGVESTVSPPEAKASGAIQVRCSEGCKVYIDDKPVSPGKPIPRNPGRYRVGTRSDGKSSIKVTVSSGRVTICEAWSSGLVQEQGTIPWKPRQGR